MDNYSRETEERLWVMTAQALNWPVIPNRWLYPTVYGWDRDGDGWLTIPAHIAFFPNPYKPLTLEERRTFQKIVRNIAPGHWEFIYDGSDIIWAQRQPYVLTECVDERRVHYHTQPTYEELAPPRLRDRVSLRARGEKGPPGAKTAARVVAMRKLWTGLRKSVRI